MGVHTADAIVLRRYPFRETSVIVSCLTDRYGKLKGLVKGLRVHPNRHRSAMEPLTINRIVFYDTHTSQIHLISQCDLLVPLDGLPQDLEMMRAAAFIAELTDTVAPLEEPLPEVYQLVRTSLERLALGTPDTRALRLHFIVRLLRLVGFQPQLDRCAGCQTQIGSAGYWSAREGGLLCDRCLPQDPRAEAADPDVLANLEALADAPHPLTLPIPVAERLHERLNEFLHWRLDRPLKTMTVTNAK